MSEAGKRALPALHSLHMRHRLTENLCGALAEAASVCLSRHHQPPEVGFAIRDGAKPDADAIVRWAAPGETVAASHANADDATRDGAYSMALAAVELERELLAFARTETRTGADFYVVPPGYPRKDLEGATRLEVSGVDHGTAGVVNRRLKSKLDQAERGDSDRPAIAAVVGFQARVIVMRDLA